MDHVRGGDGADLLADPLLHFLVQLAARLLAGDQGDIGVDALTLDLVRHAHYRRFGDLGMGDQRGFNFGGAHAVTGDVQYIIHPSGDPVVTILVATGTVAGEVAAGEGGEVGLLEPLVIAKHGAHLARPGVGDHQVALGGPLQWLAHVVHQRRLHAEEGTGSRAWLEIGDAGQRADEDAAGLGLPPGIDDGAALLAYGAVVPLPGFRVDGLAHRAHDAQARTGGAGYCLVALGHQRPDGGRGGIQNTDLVLVHHLAHAVGGRVVGHPFEHDGGGAVGKRPVDQIGVAGDPAHVGGTPVDVLFVVVEDVLEGEGGIDQIAAGGVQHPLGFAGGAGGVEDEERIFGPHRLGRAVGADGGDGVVPPDVPVVVPGDVAAGAFEHDHLVDLGLRVGERFIHVLLERYRAAAAQPFIGGDDDGGAGVDDATGQGFRRETAEHDAVHRADAGTGQHGDGGFRHHGHVEADHVAAMHSLRLQDVGKLAHLGVQLAVGELAIFGRVVPFPDDGDLVAALGQMAVQTVGRDVEQAVFIPFDGDVARIIGGVLDLGVGLHPVEDLALLAPEGIRILHRGPVHGFIASLVQQGAVADVGFDRVDLALAHVSLL